MPITAFSSVSNRMICGERSILTGHRKSKKAHTQRQWKTTRKEAKFFENEDFSVAALTDVTTSKEIGCKEADLSVEGEES